MGTEIEAALFQAMPDAVVAVDAHGIVQHANRAAIALGAVVGEALTHPSADRSATVGALTIRVLHEDRLLRELLPTMAHELRTPLNAIIGFTELIHKGKVGAILPEQEEYTGDVLTSARSLLRLLNDLLDLAKREPVADAPLAELVLADAIAEVVLVVRGQAALHGHRIEVEVDPAIGPVTADPVRLKRILYELIASAARMSPEGMTIAVVASLVAADQLRIDVDEMFSAVLPLRSHAQTR